MGKEILPRSERKSIAEEAIANGLPQTALKYGVSRRLIKSWQHRLIGKPVTRSMSSFSQGQMLEIIEEAAETCVARTAKKYKVSPGLIRCWKSRLYEKLIRVRPVPDPNELECNDPMNIDEDLMNAILSCYDDFKTGDVDVKPMLMEFLEDAKQQRMHLGSLPHSSQLCTVMLEMGIDI